MGTWPCTWDKLRPTGEGPPEEVKPMYRMGRSCQPRGWRRRNEEDVINGGATGFEMETGGSSDPSLTHFSPPESTTRKHNLLLLVRVLHGLDRIVPQPAGLLTVPSEVTINSLRLLFGEDGRNVTILAVGSHPLEI